MIIKRQKEFNSKAMKALRANYDKKIGKKALDEMRRFIINPELLPNTEEGLKSLGREVNRTIKDPIIAKGRVRSFQKRGLTNSYMANNLVRDIIKKGKV